MTLFCSTHTHLINKLSIDPVGRFNSHIFALENPSALAPSKSLTNYVLMQTATSTSIHLLPPFTAVVPIQYPTWAPFKQYVMRPPRCLTFYVSFPFFLRFSFPLFLFFSFYDKPRQGRAAAAIPCPPAWEINGPTNRRAKFSEGGRAGGTREWNGTERQGKMTTCSYKNFYLKATVRVCFRVCCCLLYLLSV